MNPPLPLVELSDPKRTVFASSLNSWPFFDSAVKRGKFAKFSCKDMQHHATTVHDQIIIDYRCL